MDLRLPTRFGAGYKSASQRARRISEPWGAENLYCCACICDRLETQKANTQVSDFLCPKCVERYQLKSQNHELGGKVLGANYQKMLDAILGNRTPNFFLLHYQTPEWIVRNLLVIPRFAISPSVIIKRKALSATARRSNWTGYLLDIGLVPASAKIPLVINGSVVDRSEVREQYVRISRIQNLKPESRGWTLDVLRCVELLPGETFTNDEAYGFVPDLAGLYPGNHHIKDKIRQQLQVLRDRGLLKPIGRGVWRRL